MADVGLLGKNIRVGGELVDAVDVFVGGRAGPHARAGVKLLERGPAPVSPARTWLLRIGWCRHGLVHPNEVPGRTVKVLACIQG